MRHSKIKEEISVVVYDLFTHSSHFDLSLARPALLDTFLCFQDNLDNVENYLVEVHRVLKDGGTLLVISHGLPETRLEYFPTEMWDVQVTEMGE